MKFLTFLTALFFSTNAIATERPIVLELYTSQGCSSCPAADEVLKSMINDPNVLPLSFHVDYWNYLGWADTLSSPENTDRQRFYAPLLGETPFTPQLIVDGQISTLGSRRSQIDDAVKQAQKTALTIPTNISLNDKDELIVSVAADTKSNIKSATIWLATINRYSMVPVRSGENRGRTLSSVNNVVNLRQLGIYTGTAQKFRLPLANLKEDGIAIIIQKDVQGAVIGAAKFMK